VLPVVAAGHRRKDVRAGIRLRRHLDKMESFGYRVDLNGPVQEQLRRVPSDRPAGGPGARRGSCTLWKDGTVPSIRSLHSCEQEHARRTAIVLMSRLAVVPSWDAGDGAGAGGLMEDGEFRRAEDVCLLSDMNQPLGNAVQCSRGRRGD
jgi:hypothetical protein